jgi:hypothetical protein
MVLDYDESDKADAGDKTEGASSEVDTELIQRDASSYNTPTISEVASRTVKSIGASGPWWDVEDGRWINDPTPSTGSVEQQAAPPAPTQSQRQLPTHSTTPLPDLTKQQEISALSQSMSAESAPHSLSESFNNGDNDFTETAQHLRLAKQDASTSDSMQPYIPSSRSSSELSHDRIDAEDHSTTHGDGCSDDELSTSGTESDEEGRRPRPKRKRPFLSHAGPAQKKRKHHLQQRSTRQSRARFNSR